MSTQAAIILAVGIAFALASLGLAAAFIRWAVATTWNRLAAAHPAVEPSPDAVCRRFQSFRMDLLNLGLSVHVGADERHLHLRPARILRVFGARPMSVPWEAIEVRGHGLTRRVLRARIDGVTLWGPAWCLELATAPVPPGGT